MMTSDSLRADAERARQIVALIEAAGRDYTVWHSAQFQSIKGRGMALLATLQGTDPPPATQVAAHIAGLARETEALTSALAAWRAWYTRESDAARRRAEAADLAAAGLDAADIALDLLARVAKSTKE